MILEIVAVTSGGAIGYLVTWKLLEMQRREEEREILRKKREVISEVAEKVSEERSENVPKDLQELVDYLCDKYMLYDLTLLTHDGLPIASNSSDPIEDAAIAPEVLKTVRELVSSDKIVVSGEDKKLVVFEVNSDVVLYARTVRDLTSKQVEMLKNEVNSFLEGYL
jgi:predicted regulator of Ras-like GTPase activity (Roadblock/LC7/MglB family)